MPLSDETVTVEEVADAMGHTADWLKRWWPSLHRRQNFPRRIPGTWTFPRMAVVAWLRTSGAAASRHEPANQNGADAFVDEYARQLLERKQR